MTLSIRTATPADLPAIERVMRASMASLGSSFYDEQQTASAVRFIAVADPQLVADGTYFVVEEDVIPSVSEGPGREGPRSTRPPGSLAHARDDKEIVACGGWSKRKKLFTGTAGQAAVEGWLDPASEPARIRAMFVHPDHARRGIGRMIVDRAEAEAREAGFAACELMATLPGVPLYAACGYEPVEPATIELPDGVRLECLRMSRRLK
jgi:predicted N-acetyltransferase YhbS